MKHYQSFALLIGMILLAMVFALALPAPMTIEWIARGAFPVCSGILILLVWLLRNKIKDELKTNWVSHLKRHAHSILASLLVLGLFAAHDQAETKVLLDEVVLQSSAQYLFQHQEYRLPIYAHSLEGNFKVFEGVPDKRPPLFPYLVSLLHLALGYDVFNAHILNFVLGFLVLFCLSKIGYFYYQSNWGAWLPVLAIGTLPLLSQNIHSSHLEILNLLLFLVLFMKLNHFVRSTSANDLQIAYILATLIALTRYEGVLAFPLVALVHLTVQWNQKDHKIPLSHVTWAVPLAIAFIVAMLKYQLVIKQDWQLDLFENDSAFSLKYWPDNLSAFFDFIFNPYSVSPNSIALSLLVIVSFSASFIVNIKDLALHKAKTEPHQLTLFMLQGICIAFLALIFSYHWGNVNTDVTSRFMLLPYATGLISFLALKKRILPLVLLATLLMWVISIYNYHFIAAFKMPTALGICFLILIWAYLNSKSTKPSPVSLISFFAAFIISVTLPSIAARPYEADYNPAKQAHYFRDWLKKNQHENYFYVAGSSYYAAPLEIATTSFGYFNLRHSVITDYLRTKKIEEIFILQRGTFDENGLFTPFQKEVLNFPFEYEIVEVKWLTRQDGARILRWKGYASDQ